MTIHLIWAEARGGVIGADGGIPWRVPGEQQIFRERTMGGTVVMGRATWESLPERVRPLPGRRNVVLTRRPGWSAAGAEVCGSVDELLRAHDDFWVMGGAAVYAALLPYAGHIVRTRIDLAVEGDTFAPRLGPEWRLAAGADTRTSDTGVQYTVEELISGPA
ncbi:dihydrofolate reductase [Amorphoplanes nipponensis]|uniref:Dihydrofolate reductase n=1 Tax=Actinoplanes nipponensis TaxID=135950 RepID=A0A919JDH0_9ACTN|nr:dihydrofolate reductase [Actinoplanes nipponensis]GIE47567.1 dihydrofolate reductase [Actinoplanes nipponensis]